MPKRPSPGRPAGRREFLKALAVPAAAALVGGCERSPAPAAVPPGLPAASGSAELPDRSDPDIQTVRDFVVPLGAEPAFVFRTSPADEP